MGLSKLLPQSTGVVASYHAVTSVLIDFKAGKTTVEIESYLDGSMAANGYRPITGSTIVFDGLPTGDAQAWAYDQVKKRGEWVDAKDA